MAPISALPLNLRETGACGHGSTRRATARIWKLGEWCCLIRNKRFTAGWAASDAWSGEATVWQKRWFKRQFA